MTNSTEKFVVWDMENTGTLNITSAVYGSKLAIGEHDALWNTVLFRGSLEECNEFVDSLS